MYLNSLSDYSKTQHLFVIKFIIISTYTYYTHKYID